MRTRSLEHALTDPASPDILRSNSPSQTSSSYGTASPRRHKTSGRLRVRYMQHVWWVASATRSHLRPWT